mgnify:FL=1
MGQEVINNTFDNNLINQYHWFNSVFCTAIKNTSDEFFQCGFSYKLMSMSLNINAMFQDDSYFVTKINIDESREVFVRCSENAIGLILDKVLEPHEDSQSFNLNDMTELEAKIITNFNDMFYTAFADKFVRPRGSLKFRTFDIVHLTFLVKLEDDDKCLHTGKIILSMPYQFLNPEEFKPEEENFSDSAFFDNKVEVDIKIGTTLFSVQDLKSLEEDDIVVFENSNLHTMRVVSGKYEKDFNLSPNPALIIPFDDSIEGEMEMENNSSTNLWDSIQVEMGAEFDKIKIPLGDLKKINEGIIIDVSSIYNNKISLKVEEKLIAEGELVIVNDRYGVKVNKVFAQKEEPQPQPEPQIEQPMQQPEMMQQQVPDGIDPAMYEQMTPEQLQQMQMQQQAQMEQGQMMPPQEGMEDQPQGSEDFDYSDFELDDEDI